MLSINFNYFNKQKMDMKTKKKTYGTSVRVSEETAKNLIVLQKYYEFESVLFKMLGNEGWETVNNHMEAVRNILYVRFNTRLVGNLETHTKEVII